MWLRIYRCAILLSLFFSLPFYILAQPNYCISGKINDCKGEKLFLSKVYGKQTFKIDSVTLKGNCDFNFVFPDADYKGVFRLSVTDSNYADIIFNKENIKIETSTGKLSAGIKIIESTENKVYYQYLQETSVMDDSINKLTALGQKLYNKNPNSVSSQLNKIAKKITYFETQEQQTANELITNNQSLFASKLIKALLLPDFKEYMKKKDAAPYPNEKEFLREHYFDNIDFADSNMVHTEIIFDKIGEYFQYFVNPPSVDAYKKAIDFILIRTVVDKNVNDYVMNTLMRTFDHSAWEDVYSYVVEKYLAGNTCSNDDVKAKKLLEKDNIIKALKQGNKAPSITTIDINGKKIILDSVKSSYTLVMFWASWCEFCEKAMPDIKQIYSTYKSKGLEIFAVSVDSVKQNWIEATQRYQIKWLNTCDLKGFRSPAIKDYNVWQTPTFFLLDADKKIIARPVNTTILKEKLGEIKW